LSIFSSAFSQHFLRPRKPFLSFLPEFPKPERMDKIEKSDLSQVFDLLYDLRQKE